MDLSGIRCYNTIIKHMEVKIVKKNLFKALCIALTVIMAACMFAACGSSGEGGGSEKEVKGETQTWGRFTLLVPENMNLKGGNILNENDPTVVTVKENDNDFHYVMFNLYDEDTCKSSVEGTKSANDGSQEFTMDVNGVTWKGVSYEYFSSPGFQMYGQVDGQYVLCGGFYFSYDSEIVKAILGSLKVAAE